MNFNQDSSYFQYFVLWEKIKGFGKRFATLKNASFWASNLNKLVVTNYTTSVEKPVFNSYYIFMKISGRHLRVQDCGLLCRSHFSHVYCILWVRRGCLDIRNWTAVRYTGSLFIIVAIGSRVVKTDQLFQNSPSKPSNGKPSEGLLQFFFYFKGHNHLLFGFEVFRLPNALPQGR